MSYAELLAGELRPGDPLRADVDEIQKAAQRAAALTRQLLAFSRQQVLEPKILDLRDLLASMENMLRRLVGEDIDMVCVWSPDPGRIEADPGSMEQVIMNLAINARDAMPTGGKLTIEIANVVIDAPFVQAHVGTRPGRHVLLAVTDTGTGMTAAVQARIFEPFFTTKAAGKGTGLGLSTVFGLVQQSGGTIWVYSEVGKGTCFKIYLPCATGDIVPASAAPGHGALYGGETILLVEDEPQVRTVAGGILRRYGYQVLETSSAGEAISISEKHAGEIHLLLTDVVMPEMSGPELARRLTAARPATKVLCMSGYADDSIVRHGVLSAELAYLQKPFTPTVLCTKVRAVLDAKSGRAAAHVSDG